MVLGLLLLLTLPFLLHPDVERLEYQPGAGDRSVGEGKQGGNVGLGATEEKSITIIDHCIATIWLN